MTAFISHLRSLILLYKPLKPLKNRRLFVFRGTERNYRTETDKMILLPTEMLASYQMRQASYHMLASIVHCIFSPFLILCLKAGEVNGKI